MVHVGHNLQHLLSQIESKLQEMLNGRISTSVRNNVDYWFFSDINQGMIKTIYECLSIPMNEKEFTKYLNDNNNDYAFIYYNLKL